MCLLRRAGLVALLLGLACTPSRGTRSPGVGQTPGRPQVFASPSLPAPIFTDPARRQKLRAAMPEIERLLVAESERLKLPGAAFGIVIDGELAFVKTVGFADVATKTPVTADSVFRIASLTKGFTAMAILQLRDEGKLALDDPAARWVPELEALAYPTRDAAPLTLRVLLSHGAGFPEDNPWGDRQLGMSEEAFSRALARGIPFSTSPGTAYEYANYGFAILGRVITRASGVDYADYLRSRVLDPLGMRATVLDERAVAADALARGYRREGATLVPETNLPHGAFGAMGGLYSSLNDMAKYVAFHLSAWPARDDAESGPLRRSSTREMQGFARFADYRVSPGLAERRPSLWLGGYGFGLAPFETCELSHGVAHGGGLPGYGSMIQFLPDHGVGFIALANVTYAPLALLGQEVLRTLREAGGLLPRAPQPAQALLDAKAAAARLVNTWSDADADAMFADSFDLDRPRATLARELEALRKAHGRCREARPIAAENALRGTFRLDCERGFVEVTITLAPTMPPKVQAFSTRDGFPPPPALAAAGDKIVALFNRWDDAAAAELLDATADARRMQTLFAATREVRGACTGREVLSSDGARKLSLRLSCERYPVGVEIVTAEGSSKVTSVQFVSPGAAFKCAD